MRVGATEADYGGQFENLISGLTAIGAAALGISVTPIAADRVYGAAQANNVAVIGHSRKATASRIAAVAYANETIDSTNLETTPRA